MLTSADVSRRETSESSGSPISAAAKSNGMNYSTFMNGLKKAGITLNRKMLSEIAINDAAGFTALTEKAKAAL
jgi:large subunit ribosomal protein L20